MINVFRYLLLLSYIITIFIFCYLFYKDGVLFQKNLSTMTLVKPSQIDTIYIEE